MYKLALIDKITHVTTYFYMTFNTSRKAHDKANHLATIPMFKNKHFTVVEQYGR